MPAIITHHQFGCTTLEDLGVSYFETPQEQQAFLLGNQGPDPLFFCALTPTLAPYHKIGNLMHGNHPALLLANLVQCTSQVPTSAQAVLHAFVSGFVCHYLLDRSAHPLIYAQQYALCNAGIEGLSEQDGREVHAVIESELDEMVLFRQTGNTIAHFVPYKEILRIDEQNLAAISYAVHTTVLATYDHLVPAHLYARSVHNYRLVEQVLYSPRGFKRSCFGMAERRFRRHSYIQAFSPRPVALETSVFGNHEHARWTNPFTQEHSTLSFEDIYEQALNEAREWIPRIQEQGLSKDAAHELTNDLTFSGKPVE